MRYPIDKAMAISKALKNEVTVDFKEDKVFFKGKSGTLELFSSEVIKQDVQQLTRRVKGKCLR